MRPDLVTVSGRAVAANAAPPATFGALRVEATGFAVCGSSLLRAGRFGFVLPDPLALVLWPLATVWGFGFGLLCVAGFEIRVRVSMTGERLFPLVCRLRAEARRVTAPTWLFDVLASAAGFMASHCCSIQRRRTMWLSISFARRSNSALPASLHSGVPAAG